MPTYVRRDLLTQGLAAVDENGRPVIYIGRDEAMGDPAYRDFLMAHECCHHTRGHLKRLKEKRREKPLLAFSAVSRSLELDADCCAAVALAKAKRADVIRETARRMRSFGAMPTGSGGYPTGDLRATLIEGCAAKRTMPAPPDLAILVAAGSDGRSVEVAPAQRGAPYCAIA